MASGRPPFWVAEPTSSQAAESERTVPPIGCIAFLESASAQRSSKQHSCGRKEVCACAPHKAHFLPGDRYEMTAGVSNTRSSIGCRACLWPKSVKHQDNSSYPATVARREDSPSTLPARCQSGDRAVTQNGITPDVATSLPPICTGRYKRGE